jgi:hypothetical protein
VHSGVASPIKLGRSSSASVGRIVRTKRRFWDRVGTGDDGVGSQLDVCKTSIEKISFTKSSDATF